MHAKIVPMFLTSLVTGQKMLMSIFLTVKVQVTKLLCYNTAYNQVKSELPQRTINFVHDYSAQFS